jgi:DNA-binding phage protein
MNERIKVEALPEFDAASFLDSDEAVAAYLTDVLQDNNAAFWQRRLGTLIALAACERDMTQWTTHFRSLLRIGTSCR